MILLIIKMTHHFLRLLKLVMQKKLIDYLVSRGDAICFTWISDVNIRSENDRAVRYAFGYGLLEVVKYLVSQGADIRSLTKKHQKYILFCQKMEEKKKERAQKKIYFWWIQICYDPNTKVGKRMQEKSWLEFDKVQKNKISLLQRQGSLS